MDVSRVARQGAFLGGVTSEVRSRAAEFVRRAEGRVLDVGCGNGLLFAEAGQMARCARVGLDGDGPLLQEAQTVMADNGIACVSLVRGDAFAVPLKANSADLVLLLNTLMNIPSDRLACDLLKGLMALCRVGGRIVFDFRNAAHPLLRLRYALHNLRNDFVIRAYSFEGIVRICRDNGFKVLTCQAIGPRFLPWAYLVEARKEPV